MLGALKTVGKGAVIIGAGAAGLAAGGPIGAGMAATAANQAMASTPTQPITCTLCGNALQEGWKKCPFC